jgi:hypothetical protein
MSYVINLPNGTTLGTVLDGTINNTATSLTLVGRNYSGYGQIIQNDLIALLVNFAYSVSPTNPQTGQIWYDSGNSIAKVWTGSIWKNLGSCTSQATAPSSTIPGDLWFASADKQLYVYDGTTPYPGFPAATGWILVGPGYSVLNGKSTAIRETINNGVTDIPVTSIYLDGIRTAIISSSAFIPATPITGFSSIQTGWNMNSAYTIYGTANNASYLGTQPAANYFRNNLNNSGTGTLTILNNSGLTLGNYQVATLSTASNTLTITNNINGGNISVKATTAGISTQYLSINGVTGAVEVAADPTTVLGVTTKQYVDNKFINTTLYGTPTASTASAGTSTTQLATTEFVVSGLSGLFPYKIYKNTSWMWMDSTSANLQINGSTVMTASSSGLNLYNGATAITQGQTYATSGNSLVATTQFVKTATTWWGGSAKFVSADAPNPGINDNGSNDGDFWFQYSN